MLGGYAGKILRINLSEKKTSEEKLSEDLCRDFLGGRGFGAKILYDELKPGIDPLGPENKIVISASPLIGTAAHAVGRFWVTFKSPATGGYARSNCSTPFMVESKKAGYDVIIIEGKADKPTYVWIRNDRHEFRDASHIWGCTTDVTRFIIADEIGEPASKSICIGPAGERLVRFASIHGENIGRPAARGGGGAVMGSKNLKAIAIRGTRQEITVADPEAFKAAVKEQVEALAASPGVKRAQEFGTMAIFAAMNELGLHPTRNFREGIFEDYAKIAGEARNKYLFKRYSPCEPYCMIACGKLAKVTEGPFAGVWVDGPEYQTMGMLGSNCGNSNIESIFAANLLCDLYGIDTISTGSVLAFAMELYERGIITKKDTDGVELTWGNYKAMLEMIRKIAFREGFGNILAEGVKRAAEKIGKGAEKYAIHIKGLEHSAYDSRGAFAFGLGYITNPVGGSHAISYVPHELWGLPWKVDRFEVAGKAELSKWCQDKLAVGESGSICTFPWRSEWFKRETFPKLLAAATGRKELADFDYIMKIGERIFNVERAFNVREGFDRKDDTEAERILKETLPKGASAGKVFPQERLLDEYYKVRGWDKNGLPTRAKLEELGLKAIADDLEKMGRLGR